MIDREDIAKKEEKEVSRRDFLKKLREKIGGAALIIVSGEVAYAIVPDEAQAQETASTGSEAPPDVSDGPDQNGYDASKHEYVYLIDITKCIGCGSCVRACEMENNVPPNYFRTWVERYLVSRTGEVRVDSPNGARGGFDPTATSIGATKAFFLPKLCNHCAQTPCVPLCPVGASYRAPDGVILVDEKRCIGCGYCVQACPYGSRFIHPETHTASKCTLCYHRITKGLKPACIQACPTEARRLGDLKDPEDEVADIIATKVVHTLKPELLTDPRCYYQGLGKEARG